MRIPLGVGDLNRASWEVELHIAGRMAVFEKGVGCGQRGGAEDVGGDERSKGVYFALSETFNEVTNGGQPEFYARRDFRKDAGRKTREYELEEAVDSIMDGSYRRTFDCNELSRGGKRVN
jgi:hypothetical protein